MMQIILVGCNCYDPTHVIAGAFSRYASLKLGADLIICTCQDFKVYYIFIASPQVKFLRDDRRSWITPKLKVSGKILLSKRMVEWSFF